LRFVRSAILVAAAVTVPFVPTAASANSNSHTDSTGDLQSIASDAQGHITGTTTVPEPTATQGDVTRIKATNGARTVKVVMRFAELNTGGLAQVHEVFIATKKMRRVALVSAYPGKWGGKSILRTPQGKKVRCSVHHHIDYAHNKVVVKVPSSCVGRPKVIKVGAFELMLDGSKVFFDDAYAHLGAWTDDVGLSPKIRR
jgi:hypothetical protein